MKNKRGSHVGFVVSFVIFITFLVFLYAVLQPTVTRDRSKSYVLDYLALNLINASTSEVTTVTVLVSETNKPCVNLQNIGESIIPSNLRDNLIIRDSSGTSLEYQEQGQGILVGVGDGFSGIITIYYSEDIINAPGDLGGCDPHSDPIGVVKTYEEFLESNLLELNESYYLNYEGLKAELGLPEGTEFSFSLLDGDRVEIFKAEIEPPPDTQSVYVQETPIQYIGKDGKLKFGFLVIRVW